MLLDYITENDSSGTQTPKCSAGFAAVGMPASGLFIDWAGWA